MKEDEAHLTLLDICSVLNEIEKIPEISRISFAGGEPFLYTEILEKSVKEATDRKLNTTIVTSAFWATRPNKAIEVLKPIVNAGLQQLNVSYDDEHAKFVPEKNILNVCRAAKALNIVIALKIAVEKNSIITKDFLENLLKSHDVYSEHISISEYAVISTGRGKGEQTREKNSKTYLGPCRSALRQFSVYYGGSFIPCCSAAQQPIKIKTGNIANGLSKAIVNAYDNDIIKFLAFEGPVEILKQITADTAKPFQDDDFDGVCHACEVLFYEGDFWERLKAYLPQKQKSLAIQEIVYREIGSYKPPTIIE